ncbi:MAG: 4-hydroxy-3-methylbut-2-enyl diphosphate reductase [Pseudomonadota bacterium]
MSLTRVILANPRGFCAGVDRAIQMVELALQEFGAPIYVRHEIVHNVHVVRRLEEMGAIFTDELNDIPEGSVVIFSAHGVSEAIVAQAKQRQFQIFDATCPLVSKVHMQVVRYSRQGRECILIGHAKHPEVEGTMGHYSNEQGGMYLVETPEDIDALVLKNPAHVSYVTQTTLSVADTQQMIEQLKRKFPAIAGPAKEDICYATQNRQDAVDKLSTVCDTVLVIGSQKSSNSQRLADLAQRNGLKSYLIDDVSQLTADMLTDTKVLGVTAGASAPEHLVQTLLNHLKSRYQVQVETLDGPVEDMYFALPGVFRSLDVRKQRAEVVE